MSKLEHKHCIPCEGGVEVLTRQQVERLLQNLAGWQSNSEHTEILKDYQFSDYHQTIAFVNTIANMAHQENHHPDLEVGYNHCLVRYSTHAINGLSENDFICAAKVEALAN